MGMLGFGVVAGDVVSVVVVGVIVVVFSSSTSCRRFFRRIFSGVGFVGFLTHGSDSSMAVLMSVFLLFLILFVISARCRDSGVITVDESFFASVVIVAKVVVFEAGGLFSELFGFVGPSSAADRVAGNKRRCWFNSEFNFAVVYNFCSFDWWCVVFLRRPWLFFSRIFFKIKNKRFFV